MYLDSAWEEHVKYLHTILQFSLLAFVVLVNGVMHFTYKREAAICLLITKVDSKCDSGLRRFDGKVH